MELLLGILIGVGLPWAIKTVKAARSQGATFIIKGYQVRIEKLEASSNKKPVAEVVPMKKKTPPVVCDLCEGEKEIRIAGVKSYCPKCKGAAAQGK